MLAVLEVDCTEGASEIDSLQAELETLETLNDDLKSAIEDQDKENAKIYAQEAMSMIPGILKSLESIVNTCSEYIE